MRGRKKACNSKKFCKKQLISLTSQLHSVCFQFLVGEASKSSGEVLPPTFSRFCCRMAAEVRVVGREEDLQMEAAQMEIEDSQMKNCEVESSHIDVSHGQELRMDCSWVEEEHTGEPRKDQVRGERE